MYTDRFPSRGSKYKYIYFKKFDDQEITSGMSFLVTNFKGGFVSAVK